MTPPLAVDIDGTLSRADQSIDHRVLPALREWEAPVVLATGKALPYPVALCQFVGVPGRVIAENGGVSYVDRTVRRHGDGEAARAVLRDYRERGHDAGWEGTDVINLWRETEVAVSREAPLAPLEALAAERGLEVVDTGYAYHVKSPTVSKGAALEEVAAAIGVDAGAFLAVGDSANDVSMFEVAGESWAVANADGDATAAADRVADRSYADGFLEAIDRASVVR